MKAAKFWVSLAAALAGGALTVVAPDSQVGHILSVVIALAGTVAVYMVPNAGPTPPAGVTGTKVNELGGK